MEKNQGNTNLSCISAMVNTGFYVLNLRYPECGTSRLPAATDPKDNTAFERCIDAMSRLIVKYGSDMLEKIERKEM